MPTGYTAPVADGKIVDRNQFILRCARAFGALIELRDDSLDAPLPEQIKVDSYHKTALEKAKNRMLELQQMNRKDIERNCKKNNEAAKKAWEESVAERDIKRVRYESMLDKVKSWTPPTKDHQELKRFMIDQISESIKYDCSTYDEPQAKKPDDWYVSSLRNIQEDIDYHTKKEQEEQDRNRERNEWLRDLRDSLV